MEYFFSSFQEYHIHIKHIILQYYTVSHDIGYYRKSISNEYSNTD